MNSRRIIDCVMRGDKEEATRILRESLDKKQVEAALEQSVAIAYNAIHESDAADAAAAAAEQGLPDPALDPAMTKEFFLKTFEVNGTPVTLKKVGLGASAPVSSFIDGERWEMFMTPQQATREAKKYITSGQHKKDADARAAAIAAAAKEAEKEEKPSVKKESVELEESMTFEFGTSEQASRFADEAVRQRLAATTDQYKSNYGDYMVELSSNSGSTGSPTMTHKSLVKLMKKHGGKLHSTNEGPRIKKVFSELAEDRVQHDVKRMSRQDKQKLADKLNDLDLSGYGDYEARVDNVHKFKPSDLKMAMQMMSLKEEQLDEKIKGLENKAKKSGISYGILKKVYDRGMEAWRSGHRPGATQHQWAFARVNSFITGGKTRTTADKDLWAQHKGNKKESVEEGLRQAMSGKRETDSQKQKRRERDNFDLYTKRQKRVAALRGDKSSRELTPGQEKHYRQTARLPEETQLHEATSKSYKFKDFKTADAFAKACDEIVDSSDLTVNKKTNEVTVEFRRRSDAMIIDSLAKDYGA